MSTLELSDLYPRIKPISESPPTVAVYDRPVSEVTNWHTQIIGTVFAGVNGVEAHRPHDSLADRHSARIPGSPFPTIGDGVLALVADYEGSRTRKFER